MSPLHMDSVKWLVEQCREAITEVVLNGKNND